MAPKKEFSVRAKDRMLKDAWDAIKERDRTIILLKFEKREECEHVQRLQHALGKERTQYEDRLALLDKAYGEEMARMRELLGAMARYVNGQGGGDVLRGGYGGASGGSSGATPKPPT